jgi:hypothetical protein
MTDVIQLIFIILAGSTIVFGTIAIWILMGYYSIRLFRSFKGGVLSYGWKYICIAVPFLIFGQLATGLGNSNPLTVAEEILRSGGAAFFLLGGIMIVIGFRAQYKAWNPKGMKEQMNAQPVKEAKSKAQAPVTA